MSTRHRQTCNAACGISNDKHAGNIHCRIERQGLAPGHQTLHAMVQSMNSVQANAASRGEGWAGQRAGISAGNRRATEDHGDQGDGEQDHGDQDDGDQGIGEQEHGQQEHGEQGIAEHGIVEQDHTWRSGVSGRRRAGNGDQVDEDKDDGEQDDGEQDDGEQDDGEQDDGQQDDGEQDDGEQGIGEQGGSGRGGRDLVGTQQILPTACKPWCQSERGENDCADRHWDDHLNSSACSVQLTTFALKG
jgi:hypothetical protein